jgi:hypothetical protein
VSGRDRTIGRRNIAALGAFHAIAHASRARFSPAVRENFMALGRRTVGCWGLIVAGLLVAAGARAQVPPPPPGPPPLPASPAPAPIITSPIEISSCLCLERELANRQSELTVRRNAFETLTREVAEAQSALDRDRPRVDVNSQYAVDAFRQRVEQLEAMKARRDQVALPDYQSAVAAFNERVAQYTQRCSGRTLDPRVTEQVRQNLVCRMDQQ